MTLQEVFDKVWKAFVVDKLPPGYKPHAEFPTETGTCVYFDPSTGAKCAIGVCLPDKVLNDIAEFEAANGQQSIARLGRDVPSVRTLFDKELLHYHSLPQLQHIHDSNAFRSTREKYSIDFADGMRRDLKTFAKQYDLTIPG